MHTPGPVTRYCTAASGISAVRIALPEVEVFNAGAKGGAKRDRRIYWVN